MKKEGGQCKEERGLQLGKKGGGEGELIERVGSKEGEKES